MLCDITVGRLPREEYIILNVNLSEQNKKKRWMKRGEGGGWGWVYKTKKVKVRLTPLSKKFKKWDKSIPVFYLWVVTPRDVGNNLGL